MPVAAIFQVLYTPNLTQKRKKWFDGQCKFIFTSNKLRLTDDEGRLLAEQFWSARNDRVPTQLPEPGTSIRFERFIVELDSLIRIVESEPVDQKTPPKTPIRNRHPQSGTHNISTPSKSRVLLPPRAGKEPSLDEILKNNSVRVLNPLNVFELEGDQLNEEKYKSKRRKYASWGDQFAPNAPDSQEEDLFMTPVGPGNDVSLQESTGAAQIMNPPVLETAVNNPSIYPSDTIEEDCEPSNITIPEMYTLDSDLESENELEIVDVTHTETPRRSIFEDVPDSLPKEGPWTKEAYILFSWHPPRPESTPCIKGEIV